jgi:uncharacterized protein DUF6688
MEWLFVLVLILIALAGPALQQERTMSRFLIALMLSFIGVVVPLFVFLVSTFLVPEWRGGSPHGWIDCFYVGKLALTPLVFWATAALYVTDIYRAKGPLKGWVGLGWFTGAIVSTVCFLFGLMTLSFLEGRIKWFLVVPFYVCVWYWVGFARINRTGQAGGNYWKGAIGSLPFWIGSLLWSRAYYSSLPNQNPSCFIVTAASRGHRWFVGPFIEINRHDRTQMANHQLITFWQFEALWRAGAPRSHAGFRRVYNRIGSAIANKIISPWMADATYLALKPVELVADLIVRVARVTGRIRGPAGLRIALTAVPLPRP